VFGKPRLGLTHGFFPEKEIGDASLIDSWGLSIIGEENIIRNFLFVGDWIRPGSKSPQIWPLVFLEVFFGELNRVLGRFCQVNGGLRLLPIQVDELIGLLSSTVHFLPLEKGSAELQQARSSDDNCSYGDSLIGQRRETPFFKKRSLFAYGHIFLGAVSVFVGCFLSLLHLLFGERGIGTTLMRAILLVIAGLGFFRHGMFLIRQHPVLLPSDVYIQGSASRLA